MTMVRLSALCSGLSASNNVIATIWVTVLILPIELTATLARSPSSAIHSHNADTVISRDTITIAGSGGNDNTYTITSVSENGAEITVDLDNGVMVNDATVTTADIEADNGVIHVIDKVIMPPM